MFHWFSLRPIFRSSRFARVCVRVRSCWCLVRAFVLSHFVFIFICNFAFISSFGFCAFLDFRQFFFHSTSNFTRTNILIHFVRQNIFLFYPMAILGCFSLLFFRLFPFIFVLLVLLTFIAVVKSQFLQIFSSFSKIFLRSDLYANLDFFSLLEKWDAKRIEKFGISSILEITVTNNL